MSTKEKVSSRAFPVIFSNLSQEEQIRLFNAGTVRKLAGRQILQKGENLDTNFLWVLSGTLRLLSRNEDWQATRYKTGQFVGQTGGLDQIGTNATLIAEEPTELFCLTRKAFDQLYPETRAVILAIVNDAVCTRLELLHEQNQSSLFRETALVTYAQKFHKHIQKYEQSEVITTIVAGLPRLPLHISHLIELLASDRPSAKEVAALAKQDPSLVVDILKTINSSLFNLPREITDISYAITYLGFNEVYHIAISRGLLKLIPDSEEFRRVYLHSLFLSYVGTELCNHCKKDLASLLSTIGLLHDIGKTVAFLLRNQYPKWSLFIEMLDTAKLGAVLLKSWNVPHSICHTVEYQAYPSFCPPQAIPMESRTNIALLYVAHVACDRMSKGALGSLEHPYLDDYLRLLELEPVGIDYLVSKSIVPGLLSKNKLLPDFVRKLIDRKTGPF
ncbi:MAG: HDOD domain-containing protein [Syntrophobacteraceae bacterium]